MNEGGFQKYRERNKTEYKWDLILTGTRLCFAVHLRNNLETMANVEIVLDLDCLTELN